MAKKKRYPLGTFMKEFSSEAKCREYLANMRWSDGFVCPKCGCRHSCLLSNGRYQCAECHHQTSVTAGTVLHRTHMPLRLWFLAFYFVSQDKRCCADVDARNDLQNRMVYAYAYPCGYGAARHDTSAQRDCRIRRYVFRWTDCRQKTGSRYRKGEGFCGCIPG